MQLLESYDIQLAENGIEIQKKRKAAIFKFNQIFDRIYEEVGEQFIYYSDALDYLKDNKEITIDISMSKLAIMLDLGRASLYRALDTLENNNVIIKNKKQIRVVDFKKFDKLCED